MMIKDIVKLKEKIIEKRPILNSVLGEYGSMTLLEYSEMLAKLTNNKVPIERKEQLIGVITSEVERLLGKKIADDCSRQLKSTYNASTTEHTGPLSDPGMTSVSVIRSLAYLHRQRSILLSLPCSNVSFDNFSFPRGLLFHAEMNGQLTNEQVTFFGRSVDPQPILFHKGYTIDAFNLIRKRVITMVNERRVPNAVGEKLNILINEIYKSERVLQQSSYEDQLTILNFEQWRRIFPNGPSLIHIPQEKITLLLLKKYHLQQTTAIHRILFDESFHQLIIKYCNGISGAFDEERGYGTFLFWGFPKEAKYRIQLRKDGNSLSSVDGSYKIALTPEAIAQAIERNELIPSLLLTFFIITFYHGLQVIGGTGQSTYLTNMKKAYQHIMQEAKEYDEFEFCNEIQTTNTAYVHPILAFLQGDKSRRVPPTGTDIYLYGNQNLLEDLLETAKKITIEDAFSRSYPYLYRMFYKGTEKDNNLAAITEDDIEALTGLDKKIATFASIS
jgi:hypothetical protein